MSSSRRNIIAWVLQGLLGLAFIASGLNKLTHLPDTVGMFNRIGLPTILAYVISSAEVLGGIGLIIPRLTRLAAMGLIIIMVGAIIMHATKIPGGITSGVPAGLLLVLLAVLVWLRRPAQVTA